MDGFADRIWVLAGKLHPMVVHFPIALLLAAALFEFIRFRRGRNDPSAAAISCLLLGALTAVLTVVSGWSNGSFAGGSGLEVHRWLGVSVGIVAVASLVVGVVASARPGRRILIVHRINLATCAILVGLAGHFGGEMVWGTGYLGSAFHAAFAPGPAGIATGRSETPGGAGTVAADSGGRSTVDFVRDVFPILSRSCASCHGGGEPKSGLVMDSRAALLKGGESGEPAVIEGRGAESLLIRAVSGIEPGLAMPPRGERLSAAQIDTLSRWIDQGARWATSAGDTASAASAGHWHWAYRPVARRTVPTTNRSDWSRNDLDRFVLSKLEAEGLEPSPEADRATLLRRLSLDLTGLPPTPEEVDVFAADASPDAYERQVDRLLASPHYGERWARVWLDLARYADTHGYEKDARRVMWPYRDWVIDAYNRDMPFDQFTIEQIAGDMLPRPTLSQRIATGFNRNTQINEEGGTDPEEFRVEAVLDRVNTVSSVWLGTTLACAQCHDHKYDPLPQRDYYRFMAFLNQDEVDAVVVNQTATEKRAAGPMVDVPRRADLAEFEQTAAEVNLLRERVGQLQRQAAERRSESEASDLHPTETSWKVCSFVSGSGTGDVKLQAASDSSIVAGGGNPESSTYTLEVKPVDLSAITAIRLEALPDNTLATKACGRSDHGNFLVSELRIEIVSKRGARRLRPDAASASMWHTSDDPADDWPAWLAIDGTDAGRGWTVHPHYAQPQSLFVRFAEPAAIGPDDSIRLNIVQNWGTKHTLSRFRISATDQAVVELPAPSHLAAALAKVTDARSDSESRRLSEFHAAVSPELSPVRAMLAGAEERLTKLIVARTFVMGRAAEPRKTFVFGRGSFLSPEQEVTPGVPAVLAAVAGEAPSPDRLGLARWLVDRSNPLTARVQVNRFWSTLFGRGIVETEEDFGTQAEAPTNSALLDHLAARYMDLGWSQKKLLHEIVTSATYRQQSSVGSELLERDPYNKLLARGSRFRVEAETIRDIALSVSGLLSSKMFGESVFPPQPDGIWTMIYSNDSWTPSAGEDRYRRGLYTFARRTAPYPTFTSFDAPSREVVCTRRPRTNTPLQALTTLNDPQFVEAAGVLAVRMMRERQTPEDRAARGLRLAIGREPAAAEVDRLVTLAADQLSAFRGTPAEAEALCAQIPQRPTDLPNDELAAWTVVANVILNLDETMTRP